MYEYFKAVARVPQWNTAAFLPKIKQSWFRYYQWHVDLANLAHLDHISKMLRVLYREDRENQINCHALLEKLQVLPFIELFCSARSQEAIQPDYVDLYYLFSHILETRPKVVLELGSGVSTAVMAAALRHNGEGRLYSVDPNPKSAASTARCVPGELREWCEVSHSESEPAQAAGRDTSRFKTLPVGHADMVYLYAAHKDAIFKGAETVHAMLPRFKGGETILVDGRWHAIEFFSRRPVSYDMMAYANVIATDQGMGAPFTLDIFSNAIVTVRQPSHA